MDAPVEVAEQRDWSALPAGVLQHVFCRASTWQAPGSCVAAPVCRAWRTAAAGCSGIRLLYHMWSSQRDQPFADWLERNSRRLVALTLTSSSFWSSESSSSMNDPAVDALAKAATAAQAEGRPLQLHTLRVLPMEVDLGVTGRLLAGLPNLRCLQLHMGVHVHGHPTGCTYTHKSALLSEAMAPLQHATQLEELYLTGSCPLPSSVVLPVSLRRLSCPPGLDIGRVKLNHLTQLTFLHLHDWRWWDLKKTQLPPGLQQLIVMDMSEMQVYVFRDAMEILEKQRHVVIAMDIGDLESRNDEEQRQRQQQLLSVLPNLTAATIDATSVRRPLAQAACQQLTQLSVLKVDTRFRQHEEDMQAAVAAAAGVSSLRNLHLANGYFPQPPPPIVLTQLTQLRLSVRYPGRGGGEAGQAWVEVLQSLAGLRWLSVPSTLLKAGTAWLGSLNRLQVLVVCCKGEQEGATPTSSMPWLEGCSQEVLPPSLRVFAVTKIQAGDAHSWQVRRRLQQALGSSGCEVVVGPDLHKVAAPAQQLAGLPASLQQVLA